MEVFENFTRTFAKPQESSEWIYLPTTYAWRLFWGGGKRRIVFRSPWGSHQDLVDDFDGDFLIVLITGRCDPSRLTPSAQKIVAWLQGCRPNRRWIRNVQTTNHLERERLDYWVEFDVAKVHDTPSWDWIGL